MVQKKPDITAEQDAILERALAPVRARFIEAIEGHILSFEALRREARNGHSSKESLKEIGQLAHKIAGIAGSVGYEEIGEAASTVERRVLECEASALDDGDRLASVDEVLEPLLELLEMKLDD
ncbi:MULTISPECIES: Hpt domain-containing protein [Sediminimonas]|uniref:HPt domain-containing protein n=1 Tax=Sediminimonas qiaohouensis TaxID=552061 RepID=A0A7C9HMP6_9RHOB|nr:MULTISPECIES: Hpt domain-containing protein [Sediminimonas]MDR9484897.1 Hpt domain-containing protein [Sediminimonas sp.]MTJ04523.1 hypothetical protein [Sediminimonas qiaohouensis]